MPDEIELPETVEAEDDEEADTYIGEPLDPEYLVKLSREGG